MSAFPAFGLLDAAADYPADSVVVLVGISLVFLILLLLTFIISLQGKFFDRLEASRQAKRQAAQASVKAPAAAPPPEPVIEQGISPEVVAAISAAIAAMGNGKYQLRALSRAQDSRGAWGKAGMKNDTEPF